MLFFPLYTEETQVYTENFWEKWPLPRGSKQLQIIVPNQGHIERIQGHLARIGCPLDVNVTTLFSFYNRESLLHFQDDILKRQYDQGKLTLLLGTVWKKFFPSFGHECFFRAVQVFQELRGLTLHGEATESVLEHFESPTREALAAFWNTVEALKIIDSSKLIDLLKERLVSNYGQLATKGVVPPTYIFWNFSHFTTIQLDFILGLSQATQVFLPLPGEVFHQAQGHDWINWLKEASGGETFDVDKSSGHNHTNGVRTQAKFISFPKGQLGTYLKVFFHQDSVDRKESQSTDIYLGTLRTTVDQVLEVPLTKMSFKVRTSFIEQELEKIYHHLEQKFFFEDSHKVWPTTDFLEELRKMAMDQLASSKDRPWPMLKAISSLYELIKDWGEQSQENEQLGAFDFKVIRYVMGIDLHKSFLSPIWEDSVAYSVRGLDEMEITDGTRRSILCVSSAHSPPSVKEEQYTEAVIQAMASLGPVRKGEVQRILLKMKVNQLVKSDNSIFFVEEGLLEEDLFWNDLLAGEERVFSELKASMRPRVFKDSLVSKGVNYRHTFLSASRLQTYLDCPRKFFYEYACALSSEVKLKQSLQSMELGNLEHQVLRVYLSESKQWSREKHFEVVQRCFKQYVNDEKMKLRPYQEEMYLSEIRVYTENVIKSLLDLSQLLPDVSFTFEESLVGDMNTSGSEDAIRGSADLVLRWEDKIGVFDFKRSSWGIPKQKELEGLEKIQLMFYLGHLRIAGRKPVLWGYLCLSDLSSSLIYTHEANPKVQEIFKVKKLFIDDQLQEKLNKFKALEKAKLKEMVSSTEFPPQPRSPDVCLYCLVKNICPRSTYV